MLDFESGSGWAPFIQVNHQDVTLYTTNQYDNNPGPLPSGYYTLGTTVGYNINLAGASEFSHIDGLLFNIYSMDVAPAWNYNQQVTFTGVHEDGSEISSSFTLAGPLTKETWTAPPGFTNLKSFKFETCCGTGPGGNHVVMDNIRYAISVTASSPTSSLPAGADPVMQCHELLGLPIIDFEEYSLWAPFEQTNAPVNLYKWHLDIHGSPDPATGYHTIGTNFGYNLVGALFPSHSEISLIGGLLFNIYSMDVAPKDNTNQQVTFTGVYENGLEVRDTFILAGPQMKQTWTAPPGFTNLKSFKIETFGNSVAMDNIRYAISGTP